MPKSRKRGRDTSDAEAREAALEAGALADYSLLAGLPMDAPTLTSSEIHSLQRVLTPGDRIVVVWRYTGAAPQPSKQHEKKTSQRSQPRWMLWRGTVEQSPYFRLDEVPSDEKPTEKPPVLVAYDELAVDAEEEEEKSERHHRDRRHKTSRGRREPSLPKLQSDSSTHASPFPHPGVEYCIVVKGNRLIPGQRLPQSLSAAGIRCAFPASVKWTISEPSATPYSSGKTQKVLPSKPQNSNAKVFDKEEILVGSDSDGPVIDEEEEDEESIDADNAEESSEANDSHSSDHQSTPSSHSDRMSAKLEDIPSPAADVQKAEEDDEEIVAVTAATNRRKRHRHVEELTSFDARLFPSVPKDGFSSTSNLNPAGKKSAKGRFNPEAESRHFLRFENCFSVEQQFLFQLCVNTIIGDHLPYSPESWFSLGVVSDLAHPAFRGLGLYAKQRIPAGTIVTSYAGILTHDGHIPHSQTCTMCFGFEKRSGATGEENDLSLDGEMFCNFARFANDPRGLPTVPPQAPSANGSGTGNGSANAQIQKANVEAVVKLSALGEEFSAIITKRVIQQGEEILLDYGKKHALVPEPWHDRDGNPLSRKRLRGKLFDATRGVKIGTERHFVAFQCAWCGRWTPISPIPSTVSCCHYCQEPRGCHCDLKLVPQSALPPIATAPPSDSRTSTRVKLGGKQQKETTTENPLSVPAESSGGGGSNRVPCKWPLNLPFISWHIWHPNVDPVKGVLRHTVFRHQETISVAEKGVTNVDSEDSGGAAGEKQSKQGPTGSGSDSTVGVFSLRSVDAGKLIAYVGGTVIREVDVPNARLIDASPNRLILKLPDLLKHATPDQNLKSPKTNTGNGKSEKSGKSASSNQTDEWKENLLCTVLPTSDEAVLAAALALTTSTDLFDSSLPPMALIVTNEFQHINKAGPSGAGASTNAASSSSSGTKRNVEFRLSRDNLGCIFVGCFARENVAPWEELLY